MLGVLVALIGLIAPPAHGDSDEVDPAEDNPPGCTTATAEDQQQCGAQGRASFNATTHIPPIDACNNITSPAGSVVTRILPQGPRREDGSAAFVSGACVYLPPGYQSSGLRYPVVYLLHGGGGDQGDWVTQGNLQEMLDAAAAADPTHAVIAVMPDGRSGQWFDYYDGSFKLETYVLHYLLPYVDRHFRTIADRRGRAITGLSNGGYGALHFAAKAPDAFVAVGSMSGNLGARTMSGLGTPIGDTGQQAQEAGAYYYGNVPISLVPNLDPVDITIDWGASCSSDVTIDLCATWGFEQSFRLDNQAFRNELDARGYSGTYEYRETEGAHAWRWWSKWLRERHLPFFFARLSPPEPAAAPLAVSPVPASFRYRSIAPTFSVWGYTVATDRPVREFLDLTDVTVDGLRVRGTGPVTITTAASYTPGATYRVSGAPGDATVIADAAGRLTFGVDLGPAHTIEQYSPEARAEEAAGAYTFVERTVVIRPS